ncbi:uncharacterized protein BJX67DRAFT_379834 [Aspergillus lucknowensis]|uniref:Uncharacterized protein n=1 Tax=Aspergillus lucknowensis TaxID=176173 RepID=A0ABR4LWM5_9EURO
MHLSTLNILTPAIWLTFLASMSTGIPIPTTLNTTGPLLNTTLPEVPAKSDALPDLSFDTEEPWIDPSTDEVSIKHTLHCYVGKPARYFPIFQGVFALRKRTGRPTVGPWKCGKVWCDQDVCINWCNDTNKRRSLPSYNNIADAVQVMLNECAPKNGRLSGQLDHPDHWRAVLHGHKC